MPNTLCQYQSKKKLRTRDESAQRDEQTECNSHIPSWISFAWDIKNSHNLYFGTHKQNSSKLSIMHFWVKWIKVSSNEGSSHSRKGDNINSPLAKTHWWLLKIIFSWISLNFQFSFHRLQSLIQITGPNAQTSSSIILDSNQGNWI